MDVSGFYVLSAILASLGVTLILRSRRRRKIRRRYWVRPWIRRRNEPTQKTMIHLYKELLVDGDVEEFRCTLRMEPAVYEVLLNVLRPKLTKQYTNFRSPVNAETRLAVTLRYLALGEGFRSLSQQFRIGLSTARMIVRETCKVIYRTLQPKYLTTPTNEQEWKAIADDFQTRWQFPHCLGSIDGKHVRIIAPRKSGTFFYNYKDFFSIVLLAIVNANYEFIYIDIGAEGKASDGGIWNRCSFSQHLNHENNLLGIPQPSRVNGMPERIPYFPVGDDAFRLSQNLMKPFPGSGLSKKKQIFNYRLSRARRIVENVFGILSCRFQIFRRSIEVNPAFVEDLVLACCVLHNFLRKESPNSYIPSVAIDHELQDGDMIAGAWRQEVNLEPLRRDKQKNATEYSKKIRLQIADYFLTAQGEVPWQYRESLM